MVPATGKCLTTLGLGVVCNAGLELGAEVTDQTLDGPGESLTKSANGVALDLLGELLHHVNLTSAGLTLLEAVHDLLGPLGTLTAGSALSARLVVVELGETGDGANDVGALVHDNNGGGTETRLRVLESVEVHKLVVANLLGKDRGGGTTGNDSLEVVPATNDTTAVLVNQLAERDGHLLLDCAGVVDVTRDTEKLGTSVTLATEGVEPAATTTNNGRGDSNGLDVGDGRRATEKTDGGREWGLQARLSRLALERLDEGSLLTTDVGSHTTVDVDVEVVSSTTGVLSDETSLVGFLDGALKDGGLVVELATDVDVGGGAVHGATGDQTSLEQLVGVLAHNLTVLAGSGLTLIGVDDQVAGLGVLVPVLEVHERPLHARGETSSTTATETRGLDFRDNLYQMCQHGRN